MDWDDCLVDVTTQEWLPGALVALRRLLCENRAVIIHTCRANWPEGLAQIEAKLDESLTKQWRAAFRGLRIIGKPSADAYIDNLAVRFTGDWPRALREAATVASS